MRWSALTYSRCIAYNNAEKGSLRDAAGSNTALVLRAKLHLADVVEVSIRPTQQTKLEILIRNLQTLESWHPEPGMKR